MTVREIVAYVAFPLLLIVAGLCIRGFTLWSTVGSITMPWFCTALALAILIVGTASLLSDQSPRAVSWRRAAAVFAIVMLVLGLGFFIDAVGYRDRRADLGVTLAEWLGFGVILGSVFLLSRRSSSRADASTDARR